MRIDSSTRTMGEWVDCPHCGRRHTKETAFERWVRNHPDLDSKQSGIVRFDLDILLHKYFTKIDGKGIRDLQAMMFIEVKTNWAESTQCQRDTLDILNQLLNNRRPNVNAPAKGRRADKETRPVSVVSCLSKRATRIWLLGGHCLRLSGSDPTNSDRMEWDRKPIDTTTLIGLLTFKFDPHDPRKEIDWRRRYKCFITPGDSQIEAMLFYPESTP